METQAVLQVQSNTSDSTGLKPSPRAHTGLRVARLGTWPGLGAILSGSYRALRFAGKHHCSLMLVQTDRGGTCWRGRVFPSGKLVVHDSR